MNDILILIGRSIRNALRQPAAIIPNIAHQRVLPVRLQQPA